MLYKLDAGNTSLLPHIISLIEVLKIKFPEDFILLREETNYALYIREQANEVYLMFKNNINGDN